MVGDIKKPIDSLNNRITEAEQKTKELKMRRKMLGNSRRYKIA